MMFCLGCDRDWLQFWIRPGANTSRHDKYACQTIFRTGSSGQTWEFEKKRLSWIAVGRVKNAYLELRVRF